MLVFALDSGRFINSWLYEIKWQANCDITVAFRSASEYHSRITEHWWRKRARGGGFELGEVGGGRGRGAHKNRMSSFIFSPRPRPPLLDNESEINYVMCMITFFLLCSQMTSPFAKTWIFFRVILPPWQRSHYFQRERKLRVQGRMLWPIISEGRIKISN